MYPRYCENIVRKKIEPRTPFSVKLQNMNFFGKKTNKNTKAPEQGKQAEQNKMSGDGILISLCGLSRKFSFI